MRLITLAVWLICIAVTPALAQAPRSSPKKAPEATAQPPGLERIEQLEKNVKALEFQLRWIRGLPGPLATLDCSTKKFVTMTVSEFSLVFFVACEEIATYLEGHKVHLTIGNPNSFAFTRVSGTLYHGKEAYDAFSRKVEMPVIERLVPGTWQKVVVTVNPSRAEEMRTLFLELESSTVSAPTRP